MGKGAARHRNRIAGRVFGIGERVAFCLMNGAEIQSPGFRGKTESYDIFHIEYQLDQGLTFLLRFCCEVKQDGNAIVLRQKLYNPIARQLTRAIPEMFTIKRNHFRNAFGVNNETTELRQNLSLQPMHQPEYQQRRNPDHQPSKDQHHGQAGQLLR